MDDLNKQHELYENARNRTKQKKRLYYHFVVFLVGSVFLILLNKLLKVGENVVENWFVWAIILWLFFFVLHFINVFVTHRLFGKDWERIQTEKLVMEQELKIAKLKKQMDEEYALKAKKTQELYNFEKDKKEGDLSNATEEW
ncbi:MAG: 2TM domain-containing protein [Lutibacter sp.]|nr:2TM domain-containing protein [Lutibacter sp.]MDT8416822.1 2TM domain-containing protein [Lutibacter sp.]